MRRPLPPPFPHFRDTRDLKSLRRKRDYASPISCCCDCPSSDSLIFGGQIVHINKGKGKLALFSTKDNVLLTPHPSYSSATDLSPFLILPFIFHSPPQFFIPSFTILLFSLFLLHIAIVFPPSPHFYCFPSSFSSSSSSSSTLKLN